MATDKRLIMTYGLLTHKVAMMPLRKVTDMNYGRSLLGRMLGYGDLDILIINNGGGDGKTTWTGVRNPWPMSCRSSSRCRRRTW